MKKSIYDYIYIVVIFISLFPQIIYGEVKNTGQAVYVGDDLLRDYRPKSSLVTEIHKISRPKFPVIDVHTHFSLDIDPAFLIKKVDELGIKRIVNLSGGWDKELKQMLEKFYKPYPNRISIFCNIDFSNFDEPTLLKTYQGF